MYSIILIVINFFILNVALAESPNNAHIKVERFDVGNGIWTEVDGLTLKATEIFRVWGHGIQVVRQGCSNFQALVPAIFSADGGWFITGVDCADLIVERVQNRIFKALEVPESIKKKKIAQ